MQLDGQRSDIAEQLCSRFELRDLVEPTDFLEKAKDFEDWVRARFGPLQVSTCAPVRKMSEGRLFEDRIDILLETKEGSVVLLLSKFIGDGKNRQKHLKVLAPTLQATKRILQERNGKQLVKVGVVFVLYGAAHELEFKQPLKL